MNKKIPMGIAIGIILALTIIVCGIFWIQDSNLRKDDSITKNNKNLRTDNNYNQSHPEQTLKNTNINYEDCESITNFGSNADEKGVFVYSTICRLGSQCNRDGNLTTIENYYIRDFEGTFNKKIFTSKMNSSSWTTYSFYPNKEKNGFDVISSDGGVNKKYFVSNSGNIEELNDNLQGDEKRVNEVYKQEIYSLGKNKIAKILSPEMSSDTKISGLVLEIYYLKDGKVKKYDLNKYFSRMSGMYIDSWSNDDRYVYIAGGIYEFSAPAVLLRIDTEKEKIMQYKNLKGMVYPITVFPDKGVAFVIDKDYFGEGDVVDISTSIYALDLESGDIKIVVKESGKISPIVASYGGKAYYGVYQNEDYENQNIKYIDISRKTVENYLENAFITKPEFKSWAYTFENNDGEYFSFKQNNQLYIASFNDINNKKLLGEVSSNNCTLMEHKKEYFEDLISWTK